MLDDFTIRRAKPEDMDMIIGLCYEHAAFEREEIHDEVNWKELSDRIFKHEDVFCLVVQHENELVGFATFMKQFSTWDAAFYIYLDCLYLQNEVRGKGIGNRMMQKIGEFAKDQGCNLLQWQTPDFNDAAIKFYNSIGAASKDKKRFFWYA